MSLVQIDWSSKHKSDNLDANYLTNSFTYYIQCNSIGSAATDCINNSKHGTVHSEESGPLHPEEDYDPIPLIFYSSEVTWDRSSVP
ncbi:uncharacterized protein G2W53_038457 [Senna tora]|uniref:Uncharacterized protein n=1 Tax=Senna tora TaxID=362788 RepID=A0A834SML0_9FABA|nr:uncharacterized protein G2W53_038457 [Senna tora]